MAGVPVMQIATLQEQVERPLGAAGLNAGDAVHLGRGLQVLEGVGLVDEEVVHPQFVEHEPIVLLVLGEQVLQPRLPRGLLLLELFFGLGALFLVEPLGQRRRRHLLQLRQLALRVLDQQFGERTEAALLPSLMKRCEVRFTLRDLHVRLLPIDPALQDAFVRGEQEERSRQPVVDEREAFGERLDVRRRRLEFARE